MWHKSPSSDRGYGSAWRKLRDQVMRRDGGICQCQECKQAKRIRLAHEVDHIKPKSQGGTDELDNLQAINRDCHKRKTLQDEGKTLGPEFDASGRVVW